jgi:hypothetical protein
MQVTRSAPLIIVTAATTLMGAFDTWALTASAAQSAVGGCIGLAWGLLLSVVTRWLNPHEMPIGRQRRNIPQLPSIGDAPGSGAHR